ncbi:hypothetical protein TNCV_3632991 [Trichonephila clavipes]|nr:hypothetical protein TNCV_3632991 [Trichonephila clavipes]
MQDQIQLPQSLCSHLSGKMVSDADCSAVGPGHRAASPLVRLVEKEGRWEVLTTPRVFSPQNRGETELNHSVTSMVLKATANNRCQLALCHDEFRGP